MQKLKLIWCEKQTIDHLFEFLLDRFGYVVLLLEHSIQFQSRDTSSDDCKTESEGYTPHVHQDRLIQ